MSGNSSGGAGDGPLRIVAVDDDALILMSLGAMLEDLGHEVLEARSGEAALALLGEGSAIDLIITDQSMPGINGTQLAAAARKTRPALPVILASGYGDGPADGGLLPLSKPYGLSDLEKAIAKVLAR
jgi:CheY-like chemotaxis protein